MNISPDGVTVRFTTEPEELFLAEKSGAKPNIVRIVDNDEYEMLNTHTPKKIMIQRKEEIFLRTLTNLHFTKLFGKIIVIFSWTNEAHPHNKPNETEQEAFPPLEVQAINVSLALLEKLDHYRAEGTYDEFIYDLLRAHIKTLEAESQAETCLVLEEPSIDERFAAIIISNGTLALLQSIAHGRTMNSIIRELYDRYIMQKKEERDHEMP